MNAPHARKLCAMFGTVRDPCSRPASELPGAGEKIVTVEIKVLTATDATVLDRVAAEVFDEPVDARAARLFLADPRHHLAVACDGGVVIGFASGVHYFHPDKPVPELFVNEVGVAPTHQNRGVAKGLLRCLLQHARELGCGQAWVLTDQDNIPAQRVYAASGGTPSEHLMYSIPLSPHAG